MPKINYDFDSDPVPPSPEESAGHKWRLLAIFLVIAAITGGVIYYLYPGSEPAEEPLPNPPATEAPAEGPDRYVLPVAGEDGASSEVRSSDPVPEPEENEGSGEEDFVEEEEETEIPAVPVPEPVIEPEYTVEPEKDRPWIGDLLVRDGVLPVDAGIDSPGGGAAVTADAAGTAGAAMDEAIAALRGELDAGHYETVRDRVLEWFAAGKFAENSKSWRAAAGLLTEAHCRLIAEGVQPRRGAVSYPVRAGDSLSRIAAGNHVPIDELMTYNKLRSANHIRVGQKLLIYPGPWRIRVEKGARLLKLYNENPQFPHLFAVFDIGIGRQNLTPSADFVISTRLKEPTWYTPDGRVYPYGDPGNVLGTRFLKLASAGAPDKPLLGYGIHGTTREESVTRSESGGCIRMRNREVEQLYWFVPVGTPVEIVD